MRTARPLAAALIATACTALPAAAQLRVAQWNITNYSSGRVAAFQTAIYASFQDRSMSPDLLMVEEMLGSSGATNFLALLNTAPNSPGDWALAPFVPNSGDSSNALYYRTSKITYLSVATLDQGTGSGPGMPPRDNQRWQVRLVGYTSPGAELYLYAGHYKAGSSSSDRERRTPESQRIRADAAGLPAGSNVLLGADFNIQSWNEDAYQVLIAPAPTPAGQFFDPIASPGYAFPSPSGSWNNNSSFRFIHTQDPATCDAACGAGCNGGGMDDRHDQILVSAPLIDSQGLDYVGNPSTPYSNSTWNDPNHSYRAWGNDGTSFNCRLTVAGNSMVGPAIAQALIDTANGLGHLPIILDLQVPARVAAPDAINFGSIPQGNPASAPLTVVNDVDIALWSREGNSSGIDTLDYTLAVSSGFAVAPGPFTATAGTPGTTHFISMDTSTPGPISGTLTITSDDPDHPVHIITLSGTVTTPPPLCPCDWNNNGVLNSQDFFGFLNSFFGLSADFNNDGTTNSQDFFDFLTCFFAGC